MKSKKSGIAKPKPPVGLEFELTPPFLEANPDVQQAMPTQFEPESLPPPPPKTTSSTSAVVIGKEAAFLPGNIAMGRGVDLSPLMQNEVAPLPEIAERAQVVFDEARRREAEAFLWGAASALLVCATVGFLIWTLSTAPSPPPPGPA